MTLRKLGGRFSFVCCFISVHLLCRLHREALKQSATDPLSGRIDVGILTTGVSTAARKRRAELVHALKKLIETKLNVPTVNYQKLLQELKDNSSVVCYAFLKCCRM